MIIFMKQLTKNSTRKVFALAANNALSSVLVIGFAFAFSALITAIENGNNPLIYIFVIVGLRLATLMSRYGQQKLASNTKGQITLELKNKMIDTILNVKQDHLGDFRTVDIITRFTSDINEITQFLTETVVNAVSSIVVIVGTVFFTINLDWKLNLLVLISPPFIFIFGKRIGKEIEKASTELMEGKSTLNITAQDILEKGLEIDYYEANSYFKEKFHESADRIYDKAIISYKKERKMWFLEMVAHSFIGIAYFALSAIIAFFFKKGVGYVSGMMILSSTMIEELFGLPTFYSEYKAVMPNIRRYTSFVQNSKESNMNKTSPKSYDIEFNNVSFAYDNEDVLKKINIQIKEGKRVLLLAESGAGKSTLIKLLTGQYEGYRGSITIGGEEVKNMSVESLKKLFSYLPQEHQYFSTNMEENLKIYSDNPENFESYYDAVSLKDEIIASEFLKRQFNDENSLSDGQLKRFGWMLLFMKKAMIYIVDEGFSNLDRKNIDNLVSRLSQETNKTVIIISHTITNTLLNYVDEIYTLNEGFLEMVDNSDGNLKNYE